MNVSKRSVASVGSIFQDQYDLALGVETCVVVPALVLGRDAVAGEDQRCAHLAIGAEQEGFEVAATHELGCVGGRNLETGVLHMNRDGGFEALEPGPVCGSWPEARTLESFREIALRRGESLCAGPASVALVGREPGHVARDAVRAHHGRRRKRGGRRTRRQETQCDEGGQAGTDVPSAISTHFQTWLLGLGIRQKAAPSPKASLAAC